MGMLDDERDGFLFLVVFFYFLKHLYTLFSESENFQKLFFIAFLNVESIIFIGTTPQSIAPV